MGGLKTEDNLTGEIIGAAMRVHSILGPGLLESVYEVCLAEELRAGSLTVEVQKALAVTYRSMTLEAAYRLDLVVEGLVLVELKSVQCLEPIHSAQTMTYLKLSGCRAALLINFNTAHLRDGIRRFPRLHPPRNSPPS